MTLQVRPDAGIETVLVSAEEARCGKSWADGATSGLAVLGLALAFPADTFGERDRAFPTLVFGACNDTVEATFTRSARLYAPDSSDGRSAFLSLDARINAAWDLERHFTPRTRARAALRGWVSGRVRITPSGVLDSLDLTGRFRGFLAYSRPAHGADTVYGTWVVELEGDWRDDLAPGRARASAHFVRHGRDREGAAEESEALPYARLVERAEFDESAVDSLVTLRATATDPKTRLDLDLALDAARRVARGPVVRALLAHPARLAPSVVLDGLRYGQYGEEAPHTEPVARFIVRELGPLVVQRRRLTDREALGSAVLQLLATGRGFVPQAGPLLAAAAERADDPVYYIHFWADGRLEDVLRGLRAALDAAR